MGARSLRRRLDLVYGDACVSGQRGEQRLSPGEVGSQFDRYEQMAYYAGHWVGSLNAEAGE